MKEAGYDYRPDALVRIRSAHTQSLLSRKERFQNIKGVFHIARSMDVKGKPSLSWMIFIRRGLRWRRPLMSSCERERKSHGHDDRERGQLRKGFPGKPAMYKKGGCMAEISADFRPVRMEEIYEIARRLHWKIVQEEEKPFSITLYTPARIFLGCKRGKTGLFWC